MARRRIGASDSRAHTFGGDWTDAKLNVLAKYLSAYAKALAGKPDPARPFHKTYIDAFAGTGYRTRKIKTTSDSPAPAFPEFADAVGHPSPQELLDGSARIALRTAPAFDRYLFIERSARRCEALAGLCGEFPSLAERIVVEQADANAAIQRLCASEDWRSRRAVLFLDPYGLEVKWETIAAVAATGSIDMWLLFPLGIGVNRLLKNDGDIPEDWRAKLDALLGASEWYDEFYGSRKERSLFGVDSESVVKVSMKTIGRYFVRRLESVFAGVAPEPGVLRNSRGNLLYLLCYAIGNKNGKEIGLRIAKSLLRDIR